MADRVRFIGWGQPVPGREERGLEVFNEAIGLYGRLQQEGKIERFDTVLLDPNGQLDGYIEVRGSAQQLAAVREDAEFRKNMADAALITQKLPESASHAQPIAAAAVPPAITRRVG